MTQQPHCSNIPYLPEDAGTNDILVGYVLRTAWPLRAQQRGPNMAASEISNAEEESAPGAIRLLYSDIARRIGSPKAARAVAELAPPITLQWASHAIGWCGTTAPSRGTLGESSASARCSIGREEGPDAQAHGAGSESKAMHLQNRVTQFGDIVAIPQRGMFTGNRGMTHDPRTKSLLSKRWTNKAWLICSCEYKGRTTGDHGHAKLDRAVLPRRGGRAGSWAPSLFSLPAQSG